MRIFLTLSSILLMFLGIWGAPYILHIVEADWIDFPTAVSGLILFSGGVILLLVCISDGYKDLERFFKKKS